MEVPSSNLDIVVRIQPTPNPFALKFLVNKTVKDQGKATFTRPSEALGILLAEELFRIDGVRQLHFFENVITVTFAEDSDLDTLQLEIKALLQTRLPVHNSGFLTEDERRKIDRSHLPPDIRKIEDILDETVRMHLQGDGGDIQVVGYADHILEVRYEGACGTCPSSTAGTLDAIQEILREKFDPLLEVRPI